eukprot:2986908-Rhodomonas_salina.1
MCSLLPSRTLVAEALRFASGFLFRLFRSSRMRCLRAASRSLWRPSNAASSDHSAARGRDSSKKGWNPLRCFRRHWKLSLLPRAAQRCPAVWPRLSCLHSEAAASFLSTPMLDFPVFVKSKRCNAVRPQLSSFFANTSPLS